MEHKDILSFHNGLHHMPTVANRAADILVKMFNLADGWGWRPAGSNPCRGVARFKVEKHERFLTREELHRLGEALRAAPAERLASVHAATAIRLLVLTARYAHLARDSVKAAAERVADSLAIDLDAPANGSVAT